MMEEFLFASFLVGEKDKMGRVLGSSFLWK